MDTARDLAYCPKGPRLPASPNLDELFLEYFDWHAFCQDDLGKPTQASSHHHHYPNPSASHSSHRDLPGLITDFSSYLEDPSLGGLENDFLRMKTSFRPDDEAASTSGFSGQTPPELVQGGSTSPSDHSASASVILDHPDDAHFPYPDVTLREVQAQDDEWTYPQRDSPGKSGPREYPPRLQVPEDQSRAAGTKRRRSGDDLHKRHRQLADPNQTADVRKTGACLPCRVSKTRCQDNGVCPTCRKAFPALSHLACIRLTPAMMWPVIGKAPDVWSKNAGEEEWLCSSPQFYTGTPKDICVFFFRDPTSPALRATVQAYRTHDGSEDTSSVRTVGFPRDNVPRHEALQQWVEFNIRDEHKPDFQHSLQKFLLAYSRDGHGLPKHRLVSKVHRMNCFFRIWKTSSFFCRDPAKKITTLPVSVQAQLRMFARKALDSLEHDIFKELDDCVAQQGTPKTEERTHLSRMASAGIDHHTANSQHRLYKKLCDVFFPLLTVFYHYQFRTKKSLEVGLDWLKTGHYKSIRHCAKYLLDSRKEMYASLQSSDSDLDRRLCAFVVNHELKKLNARKRTSKTSSKSKRAHIEDECDDE